MPAKKEKAIVFTNDKGFAGKKVPSVRVILNYEDYVEELLKKIDPKRIEILNDLLESNKKKIEKDVIDSVKEDLYRDDTYDDLTNWAEVHNIDIKYLKPTMWQHQIVTLNIDSIEVEYTIDFDYKVVIETDDDETGIYDSEDHRWLFREIKKMTVKEASQYTLLLRFAIVNEEEFDDDYDILRYNNGMPFDIPKKEW